MAQMNMIEAIRSAHDVMMDKDPTVVVLGQDVGYFGGVFRCTDGLQRKFGEHRVIDAPISEGGIIGAAIGMGVNGLRPVAEIQFADYIYPGFDQIDGTDFRQHSFVIPFPVLQGSDQLELEFLLPDAASPAPLGMDTIETRELGLAFLWLSLGL